MANEAIIINNPTNTPAAVSTGYQRQNTRAEAGTNGLDCSYVAETGAAQVTLYAGGPVDYNGVLYSISIDTNLAIGASGVYYIYLAGLESAATLTPTLATNPGTFDPTKNGRYTAAGERILNWVIDYDGISVVIRKLSDAGEVDNQLIPAFNYSDHSVSHISNPSFTVSGLRSGTYIVHAQAVLGQYSSVYIRNGGTSGTIKSYLTNALISNGLPGSMCGVITGTSFSITSAGTGSSELWFYYYFRIA